MYRVGVLNVRFTGSAYERATHRGVGVRACDTSRGRRTFNKQAIENSGASVTFQCGIWSEKTTRRVCIIIISCELNTIGSAYEINQVVDFMRRRSQLVTSGRCFIGLCIKHALL